MRIAILHAEPMRNGVTRTGNDLYNVLNKVGCGPGRPFKFADYILVEHNQCYSKSKLYADVSHLHREYPSGGRLYQIESHQYKALCEERKYDRIIWLGTGTKKNDKKYLNPDPEKRKGDDKYIRSWTMDVRESYSAPTYVMIHSEADISQKSYHDRQHFTKDDTVAVWSPFPHMAKFALSHPYWKNNVNKPLVTIEIDDTTDVPPIQNTLDENVVGSTATWLTNKGIYWYEDIFSSMLAEGFKCKVWGHKYESHGIYLNRAKEYIFGGFRPDQVENMGRYEQKDVPGMMRSITFHLNYYSKCSWQDSTPRLEYCTREAIKYGAVPIVRQSMSVVGGFDPFMAIMIEDHNLKYVGKLCASISRSVRKKMLLAAREWWQDHYHHSKLVNNVAELFNTN